LQHLTHLLELEFVDERALGETPTVCLTEQTLKMRGKDKREHAYMLFVLPTDLVEPQKTAAFALEEKDRLRFPFRCRIPPRSSPPSRK
jgi:hypothetical protein